MFKVRCNIMVTCVLIVFSDALDPDKCKQKPKEKHCLIEWSVRSRWPHQVRFVFDWATGQCFEMRWSQHCPPVPTPPHTNNFATEFECQHHCSGWA